MLVIGIDPGTAITGYGIVNEAPDGSLEAIDFGVIRTPAGLSSEKRLVQLYQRLQDVILLHRPDSGSVEKIFFQRNVSTAISVGQARGVILLALGEAGIEVSEYSPLEVKQAVTGYGGAEKKQIQQMVGTLLELPEIPHPDDAADALAVAICHLHSIRMKRLAEINSD